MKHKPRFEWAVLAALLLVAGASHVQDGQTTLAKCRA